MHWRVRFVVTTHASPEQVLRAMTDSSERRLEIWNRTLDPRTYEVRAQGDTWAVARESSSGSPFWLVCRYDWSQPLVVRWTVEESSWGGSGEGFVRVAPVEGGSRVHAEWGFTGATRLRDRVPMSLLHRFPIRTVLASLYRLAFDRYADAEASR